MYLSLGLKIFFNNGIFNDVIILLCLIIGIGITYRGINDCLHKYQDTELAKKVSAVRVIKIESLVIGCAKSNLL